MTAHADRIFLGRCVQVRVGTDRALGQTVTWVKFAPERAAKGSLHGPLTIELLGNQSAAAPTGSAIEGIPRFEEGERVVLFLHAESKHGRPRPVGVAQGLLRVPPTKKAPPQAPTVPANEPLYKGLPPAAQDRIGSRADTWKGHGSIPADLLLDLV